MSTPRTVENISRASQQALRTQYAFLRPARGTHTQQTLPFRRSTTLRPRKATPASLGIRFHSTDTSAPEQPRPLTNREGKSDQDAAQSPKDAIAERKAQEPAYEMTFTCKQCLERSSHRITKQAYHFGTVLVTCPGCKNRHLISDNMKIFSDKSVTIEDILREKGQYIRKGSLGADGDVEFYDDAPKSKDKPT